MAWVTMETQLSCDVRFIFLTLRLPRPFRWFEKFKLARNRVLLSPLVSHTKYRNLHKYFIDLLTRHMILYYSGYDSRFTLKRSWFECQLVIFFFFFCSCFLFAFYCFWSCSFLSLTESIAQHLPHLSIKSQRTVDLLLYCIAKFNLFLWIHSSCLHTKAIQTPRPQLLCSKLKRVYYRYDLLFKLRKNAIFSTH